MVVHDNEGEIYTVRYDAVNAMLLNEFLKAHRNLQEQNRRIQKQEEKIGELAAVLKEQASLIQNVSAQLEVRKSQARRIVNK